VCASVKDNKRARFVLSLEAISSVMRHLEQDVSNAMCERGYWRRIDDVKWIRALWMTALVPALNVATARILEELISVAWIGTLSGKGGLSSLYKRCKYVLNNFDLMVLPSTRETQSLCDSFCTEAGELFIEGNARDHTLSSASYPRKFVCISQLLQSHDESTTMTAQVTVKVASLRELAANPSGQIAQTRMLADALVARGVSLIFCSDRVLDAELFELASRGICVTDCVPEAHLEHLAKISNTMSWISSADALAGFSSGESTMCRQCGALKSIKLVCLRGTETHLRLHLARNDLEECESRERDPANIISQLVFFCSSEATRSIYTRMLRRCLVIACSTLEGADAEGTGASCIMPGGGAGEMDWSSLWTSVAQDLRSTGTLAEGLPVIIAQLIRQHLGQRLVCNSGSALTLLLIQSAEVCAAIADAYQQPPRMLLAATISPPSVVNRALLLWNDTSRGWISSGEEGTLASFTNSFDAGVVTSARAFFYSFFASLDATLLVARLGRGQPLLYNRKFR
jgi:hypothetical protein